MNNSMRLLQIFVDVMPVVAQHRRLTIIIRLLRTIGESSSFGSLLFLLFHSLVLRKRLESTGDVRHTSDFVTAATGVESEYVLGVQVCEQYTSVIWLPSLVFLLQNLTSGDYDEGYFVELQFAMVFILEKLQDPELTYKLESGMESELLQKVFPEAVKQGDSSVSIAFEMLTHIVGGMDRTSVSNYHAKLFNLFNFAGT
ncbi:hypothetical protein Dimus_033500 [Dionaea muscipula]